MRTTFGLALLIASLAACSSFSGTPGFTNDSNDPSSGNDPSVSGGLAGPSATSSPPTSAASTCSDAAQLVYVVSEENDLYSFAPADLRFTKIGALHCPAQDNAEPFSMAVDRSGVAYVDYDDGELFRVSTTDASCTATSFKTQLGFATFGMGFSSNASGSSDETLYLSGVSFSNDGNTETGLGLATLDTSTMTLTKVGMYSGSLATDGAELTGTGDGNLYGFFEGTPAKLAAIDKTTSATPSPSGVTGLTLTENSAYAFSSWGGDFWFYASPDGTSPSSVTRLKAATDGSTSVVMPNVGFVIVGAGVSTCAPTSPVK